MKEAIVLNVHVTVIRIQGTKKIMLNQIWIAILQTTLFMNGLS